MYFISLCSSNARHTLSEIHCLTFIHALFRFRNIICWHHHITYGPLYFLFSEHSYHSYLSKNKVYFSLGILRSFYAVCMHSVIETLFLTSNAPGNGIFLRLWIEKFGITSSYAWYRAFSDLDTLSKSKGRVFSLCLTSDGTTLTPPYVGNSSYKQNNVHRN